MITIKEEMRITHSHKCNGNLDRQNAMKDRYRHINTVSNL